MFWITFWCLMMQILRDWTTWPQPSYIISFCGVDNLLLWFVCHQMHYDYRNERDQITTNFTVKWVLKGIIFFVSYALYINLVSFLFFLPHTQSISPWGLELDQPCMLTISFGTIYCCDFFAVGWILAIALKG